MAESNPNIAGVIVAASPARPDATYEGRAVLAAVVAMAQGWGLAQPLVTVFGRDAEHLLDSIDLGTAVAVVDEDGSTRGSALSVGLDAVIHLFPEAEAALVIDSDVPRIPAATVPALVGELASSERMAATPQYRYVRGGPVLIGRQLWDRLIASDSEQRLEDLLAAHPEWSTSVVISEAPPERIT